MIVQIKTMILSVSLPGSGEFRGWEEQFHTVFSPFFFLLLFFGTSERQKKLYLFCWVVKGAEKLFHGVSKELPPPFHQSYYTHSL